MTSNQFPAPKFNLEKFNYGIMEISFTMLKLLTAVGKWIISVRGLELKINIATMAL